MKQSIFVATTKEYKFPLYDYYIPIEVGYALRDTHIKSISYNDSTGDNISEKNESFCELTALYWMWKNCKSDIYGLMHYRRYLGNKKDNSVYGVLSDNEILGILNEYDFILPYKECLFGSVRDQYYACQFGKDYESLKEIIHKNYSEYDEAFDIVSQLDEIYICNIFITHRDYLYSYCEWLFDVLFQLESTIDISDYSTQQKRVFGYLSERLFNVWLIKNKCKIYETFIINTEQNFVNSLKKKYHMFEYKILKIDYLKFAYKRRLRRENNGSKNNKT